MGMIIFGSAAVAIFVSFIIALIVSKNISPTHKYRVDIVGGSFFLPLFIFFTMIYKSFGCALNGGC
ncbi:hypothetical protein [Aeromonas schubertii]